MATSAQIEANRKNAAKSTGPRTAEGKAKVRLNAVKHGMTAATAVLPHEDGQAYRHRVETWTRELNAPGELGKYLAERAARISWQLDRADAHEQARLARRIREAPIILGGAGQAESADSLIAGLLGTLDGPPPEEPLPSYPSRRGLGRVGRASPVPDDPPAVLVRKLESSAEGCRRLRAEWTRLHDWLEQLGPDGYATSEAASRLDDLERTLRLLGIQAAQPGAVGAADPRVALLLRAREIAEDEMAVELLSRDLDEDDDAPEPAPPSPRPALDWPALGVMLGKIVAEHRARLDGIAARWEAEEANARAGLATEAAFDDTAEGERLHRYQARWGRSLLRTLAMLGELRRRDEGGMGRGFQQDEVGMSHGCTQNEDRISHRCTQMDTDQREGQGSHDSGEESPVRARDLTSDCARSSCVEPCSSDAGPELAGGETGTGAVKVTAPVSATGREERRQNKPNTRTRTVVRMGPCVEWPVGNKANGAHRLYRESDETGTAMRPGAWAAANCPRRE
jgi:hypothetical protein